MKKTILMASAIAAFVIPTTAPLAAEVAAQERTRPGGGARPNRDADSQERQAQRPRRPAGERPAARAQERTERPAAEQSPRQDRQEQRQERREERREARPERPRADQPRAERPRQEQRQERREERHENRAERPRADQPRTERPRQEQRQERREDRREYRQERREDRTERRQDRREYREFRNRWNQDAWRRSWNQNRRHDWWRSSRGFSGYSGLRVGFYFAPSYGYYSVPRQYWGQRYYEGQYLPQIFWRYQVNDWRTYGLGYPPEGTAWVHVDNHLYLIDRYDGYIISVAYDAWRW